MKKEEEENLFRLLDSNDSDLVTLGLQIATNGEKENFETLLLYFKQKTKAGIEKYPTNSMYLISDEFIELAGILSSFTHCKSMLDTSICLEIIKVLNLKHFNRLGRFNGWYGTVKSRSDLYTFFKTYAPQKNLSFYLQK